MIDTLLEVYDLKDEKRTGWQLRNIEDSESVADHSWGTAFLALNYIPEKLDLEKVLKLAVIHDVAEAEIGDIAKKAVDSETEFTEEGKEKLERKAAEKYSEALNADIFEIWREYEQRETRRSQICQRYGFSRHVSTGA